MVASCGRELKKSTKNPQNQLDAPNNPPDIPKNSSQKSHQGFVLSSSFPLCFLVGDHAPNA